MVEIVFSDSEKGSMKYGQCFSDEAVAAGSVFIIKSDGTQPTQEEYAAALAEAEHKHKWELQHGKPLGGKPEDVIALSFALDIGNIAVPVTEASRKDLIARILSSNPWGELHNMEDGICSYWDGCISDLNRLNLRAKAGEAVRIWYSDAPYSMCGFYNAIDQLEGYECRVLAIKLPTFMSCGEQETKSAVSWGEIAPGEFVNYLPLEAEIPVPVQKAICMEWKKLKQENAPLRVVLNGKLHSAESDFYDGFIRKEVPKSTFKVGQLVGSVLGRNQLGIGDWLIAQRIKKMVESGEFTVIEENLAFYGTSLKKT